MSEDGSVLAVSAPENYVGSTDDGYIRIYEWNSTSWVQRGSDITGESGGYSAGYGLSLSADGSIVAVGEPNATSTIGDALAGQVRIYSWNGSAWSQMGSDIDERQHQTISEFQ